MGTNLFGKPKQTSSGITYTTLNYNYEGLAMVIGEFAKLYQVCENKELLDKLLESLISAPIGIFNT